MKKLLYLILVITAFSCKESSRTAEELPLAYEEAYWRQLSYMLELKKDVAGKHWEAFSKRDFFQPVVYYTHDGTFAVHPNDHIRNTTTNVREKIFDDTEVLRLSEKYTDTTQFNFSISYSDTDSTALYFQDNVLFFQSFDLTRNMIGITDLQDWCIMAIHELFHGYQTSVAEFNAYSSRLDIPGGPDEFLGRYHKELDWYKESVHRENELLKSIWIHDEDPAGNLKAFDSLRTARINKIKDRYGVDIREIEDYEILLEGHARYFESLCKRHLAESETDTSMLREADLKWIGNIFQGYEVKKDRGLFDIYNDRYYYQLGYNISMILEKHLPDYQQTLYTEDLNFNRYLDLLQGEKRQTGQGG